MRPEKTSIIESAPSVADIMSSAHRVGTVDFGASISGRPDVPAAQDEPAGSAQRERRDLRAPARLPEPTERSEPTEPTGLSGLPGLSGPSGRREPLGRPEPFDRLDDRTRQAAEGTGEMLELLVELMTKDLPRPGSAAVATGDPASGAGPARPAGGDDVSARATAEVAEVAASVIASMRRVREAHERHVVALELETARRCELLTSQADLDAELIRLHARREAHAIVFAARARTDGIDTGPGTGGPEVDVQGDRLDAIGETLSRFAETVDTIDGGESGDRDELFTDLLPGADRSDPFDLFDDVDLDDELDDTGGTGGTGEVDRTLARRRLDIPRDS